MFTNSCWIPSRICYINISCLPCLLQSLRLRWWWLLKCIQCIFLARLKIIKEFKFHWGRIIMISQGEDNKYLHKKQQTVTSRFYDNMHTTLHLTSQWTFIETSWSHTESELIECMVCCVSFYNKSSQIILTDTFLVWRVNWLQNYNEITLTALT